MRPASIFERLSTSLISFSKCSPLRLMVSQKFPLFRAKVWFHGPEFAQTLKSHSGGAQFMTHIGEKDALGPDWQFPKSSEPLRRPLSPRVNRPQPVCWQRCRVPAPWPPECRRWRSESGLSEFPPVARMRKLSVFLAGEAFASQGAVVIAIPQLSKRQWDSLCDHRVSLNIFSSLCQLARLMKHRNCRQ